MHKYLVVNLYVPGSAEFARIGIGTRLHRNNAIFTKSKCKGAVELYFSRVRNQGFFGIQGTGRKLEKSFRPS